MNRFSALFAVALTAMALAVQVVGPASAQESEPSLVIAILDVQEIMREASAARAIQAEIDRQREAFQAELGEQEKALLAADQKLAADRTGLSQEAFMERRKELDQQAAQLRRNVQDRKEQLEATFNRGIAQVRQALIEIVAEIAQTRGITLVINKSQVVMAANDYDITAEVMQQLNAKLPKVSFAAP